MTPKEVLAFAKEKGAKVVVAARREQELAALVSEIEAQGGSATLSKSDVSDSKDVDSMVAHAIETFGRLDYAVNNAGIEGQWAGITGPDARTAPAAPGSGWGRRRSARSGQRPRRRSTERDGGSSLSKEE